jgi:hypothetical protein
MSVIIVSEIKEDAEGRLWPTIEFGPVSDLTEANEIIARVSGMLPGLMPNPTGSIQ